MSQSKSLAGFLAIALLANALPVRAQTNTTPATPTVATPSAPVTANTALQTQGPLQQQAPPAAAPPDTKTFDPATRMFSSKNPPAGTQPGAPAPLTPEQQAEVDRQNQLAALQKKRDDAKKKVEAAHAAQKARQKAQTDADTKRMAALKQMRSERMEEMKKNREDLAKLLQEEKDARKSHEDSKKSSTGSNSKSDADYRKAETDRQKKIQALRHPKYKPMMLPPANGTGTTTSKTNSANGTGSSTGLSGTTTSGSGPSVTNH